MSSASAESPRALMRVDLEYSLCSPYGRVSPNTQSKSWFFDIPAARDSDEAWTELLNRIFYDANVRLGHAEPGDVNFLNLETFAHTPVDVEAMLRDAGASWDALPWFEAARKVIWETTACYFVDDDGQYDVMGPSDFTELVMNRLLLAGRVDEAKFVALFDGLSALVGKPPVGRMYFDDRAARFANIIGVRPASFYKRKPGETPVRSGPVDRGLIAG